MLAAAGLDPTAVVGGRVIGSVGAGETGAGAQDRTGARLGQGPFLVAEADESDGSFLRLSPVVAVITNIEPEHLDHYGTADALEDAFVAFANRVPFWGLAVLCLDDPGVQRLLPQIARRRTTYGFSPQAEWIAHDLARDGAGSRFAVKRGGEALGVARVQIPGRHNVANALAALAVAAELEVPFARAAEALASFAGIERRFELKGSAGGVRVVDDYGHHPTEIRATLAAAREQHAGRLVVVFQPHRYTRTRDLFDDFAAAFHEADLLVLTEIYAAGEQKIPGVEAAALAEAIRAHGHRDVRFLGELDAIAPALAPDPKEWRPRADARRRLDHETRSAAARCAGGRVIADRVRTELSATLGRAIAFDVATAKLTSLRVGGIADALATPEDRAALAKLLQLCAKHRLPRRVIGRGFNTLVRDDGVEGVLIQLARLKRLEERPGKLLRVEAGVSHATLTRFCRERGLAGLEFGVGIPGTLGGWIAMNAGIGTRELRDVVREVEVMSPAGRIVRSFTRDALRFRYRALVGLAEGSVVISALLAIEISDRKQVEDASERLLARRRETQPVDQPSCGSVFKNPRGDSAGQLIEAAGLKGETRGGAMISPLHANFIVNTGGATASDVLSLIGHARALVRLKTGIQLEPEVKIWGRSAPEERAG